MKDPLPMLDDWQHANLVARLGGTQEDRRKASLPRVVKLHSWGGTSNCHDYLMTDGSIATLTFNEAVERMERRGR